MNAWAQLKVQQLREEEHHYVVLGHLTDLIFESDAMNPPSIEERPYRPMGSFWTRAKNWARRVAPNAEEGQLATQVIEEMAQQEEEPIFQRNMLSWPWPDH